jgi:ribosomal protein S18 acetylase RimI-like enzyme
MASIEWRGGSVLDGRIRPYDLKHDAEAIREVSEVAYAEDLARIGRNAGAGVARERRVAAVVAPLARLLPVVRDATRGFVWEKEGRIVGFVQFERSGLAGDRWSIEALATHPDFQGRGVGGQLAEEALACIRKMGGTHCTLKVRDDNEPARLLYRDLGFRPFDTTLHLSGQPGSRHSRVDWRAYQLESLDPHQWWHLWGDRLALEHACTPQDVERLSPVSRARFKKPWIVRLAAPLVLALSGIRLIRLAIFLQERLVATAVVRCDLTGERNHEFEIRIDPEHEESLSTPLVSEVLGLPDLRSRLPVLTETRASNGGLISALGSRKFKPFATWQWLSLELPA